MENTITPPHEQLKRDLSESFTPQTTYLGSFIKKAIMDTNFKILKQNNHLPKYIRKGDVIILTHGAKSRPCVVSKVLKNRTVIYIPLTSTENIHCLTSYKSRFFGEGCFSKSYDICTEDIAIANFIGVFDNMKDLNKAIKELREFFINNF